MISAVRWARGCGLEMISTADASSKGLRRCPIACAWAMPRSGSGEARPCMVANNKNEQELEVPTKTGAFKVVRSVTHLARQLSCNKINLDSFRDNLHTSHIIIYTITSGIHHEF